MKILNGTLLVATTILSAYLVVIVKIEMPLINKNILHSYEAIAPLQEQIKTQREMVAELQTELKAFRTEVNERVIAEEELKESIRSVREAISKIYAADKKRAQGKLGEAADTLLSSKELLWKAGDQFTTQQAEFRGLMEPIDTTVRNWRKGRAKTSTKPIIEQIKLILENLGY